MATINRRRFLQGAAGAGTALALGGSFQSSQPSGSDLSTSRQRASVSLT